jgi:hypothetical protein
MSDAETWFRTSAGRCSTGVVVVPMTYIGRQSLVGAERQLPTVNRRRRS